MSMYMCIYIYTHVARQATHIEGALASKQEPCTQPVVSLRVLILVGVVLIGLYNKYEPWGSMYVNNAYFGAQCIQIGPTLGYLEPQGNHRSDSTCSRLSERYLHGEEGNAPARCAESSQPLARAPVPKSRPTVSKYLNTEHLAQTILLIPNAETQSPHCLGTSTPKRIVVWSWWHLSLVSCG